MYGLRAKTRHKCFISYHHADEAEVKQFIDTFDHTYDVFIAHALSCDLGPLINSNNTDYVMRRIRELYLSDTSVTIVMIGRCTWARRYVDWEIAATLRNDPVNRRSGLMGIILPSASPNPQLPPRFLDNLDTPGNPGYAKLYRYPYSTSELAGMIEDAYQARATRAQYIKNNRTPFQNNRHCV